MLLLISCITLTISLLAGPTHAWGSLGHRTVAYLASMHFSPQANVFTNSLLLGQDISTAALFPDKVRHMPQFQYSAGWHFIDARDSPPRQCGINMTRDCAVATGCVVSAIANHTARVADAGLPRFYRAQSLRFMLHFFGDVHQPLHTEAEARGGNDIPVVFGGVHTNLHSVWDTIMPYRLAGKGGEVDELEAAWLWASRLYRADEPLDECLDDAADCSLAWATEANSYVCSYVMADGFNETDQAGSYYTGAVPIIDDLVGKAGRRLAAWINDMSENMDLVSLQTQQ